MNLNEDFSIYCNIHPLPEPVISGGGPDVRSVAPLTVIGRKRGKKVEVKKVEKEFLYDNKTVVR